MAGQFAGKVALVTGAGSGMGQAAALAFAREGARVALGDVDERGGEQTRREIADAGGGALLVPTDVSHAADVEALLAATLATFGRLDCAFNNAGVNEEHAPLAELDEALWDRIIAVNLKGIYLCMKAEIAHLRRASGGAIVNNASIVGFTGSRNHPAYVASKHGVIGLTRAVAREEAAAGIRVNAVCPGAIHTPMYVRMEGGDPVHDAEIAASIPLGRLGQPADVAGAVLWLCSEAASFVTGHMLVVDGGETV
ncbi:MAG TPA: glucose 1-dehydrogenase [Ktedonobacterales bacterium]|nr:glucose 1-dehydrogenase [Ktedonobacterales bacterium]